MSLCSNNEAGSFIIFSGDYSDLRNVCNRAIKGIDCRRRRECRQLILEERRKATRREVILRHWFPWRRRTPTTFREAKTRACHWEYSMASLTAETWRQKSLEILRVIEAQPRRIVMSINEYSSIQGWAGR